MKYSGSRILVAGPVAFAVFAVACAQGGSDTRSPSGLSSPSVPGVVGAQAAGDIQNGPINIELVRIAQIGDQGFYASAGGSYTIRAGRETEVYVQIWNSSTALSEPPRLIVEWGDGSRDNIHCGPCRLSHTYDTEARQLVTVTLDDRAGGTTKRSFTLDTRAPLGPTPTPTPCSLNTAFVGGLDGASNSSRFEHGSALALPALGWTNVSGTAQAWDLASNGAMLGTTPYGNYEVQYDTGVAIRANTTYTVSFDIGYMAGLTGGNSGYRFQIGTLNGATFTPLGTAITGNAPYAGASMNNSVFSITGAQQVFAAGSTVSGDRLAIRWAQTSSVAGGTSDYFGFDNVKLQAKGCVVP
jgi:hypothetical protein